MGSDDPHVPRADRVDVDPYLIDDEPRCGRLRCLGWLEETSDEGGRRLFRSCNKCGWVDPAWGGEGDGDDVELQKRGGKECR